MMSTEAGVPVASTTAAKKAGSQFSATCQANRASESDVKTKIKDIDVSELSGSEGSKMINSDMEEVLKKNMRQLSNRASTVKSVGKVTDMVLPRKKMVFMTVSPDVLIKWSSKPLKNPLSKIDPQYTKDALKCFAGIQRYMGERPPGPDGKGDAADLRFIADRGICVVGLRAEIYLQLYKQLNENLRPASVLKGWEIMCVLTNCFFPVDKMMVIIDQFIGKHACSVEEAEEHLQDSEWRGKSGDELDQVKIKLMARYALNKLRGAKPKGNVPSIEVIQHFLWAPFKFNVFGETLQNVIKNKDNVDENTKLPKVLSFLAEAVLLLEGHASEGIFRVPGDLESIIMLKMRIERGEYKLDGIKDPSVPASLLKMWFRELGEPVIPNSFYERCLKIKQVQAAMDVVDELPELNRRVLKYLAKYLQVVGDPVNQPKTKMSVSNLAIVFAPNVLRCPVDNPLVILQNSKNEQHFVKLIVNYLDE